MLYEYYEDSKKYYKCKKVAKYCFAKSLKSNFINTKNPLPSNVNFVCKTKTFKYKKRKI